MSRGINEFVSVIRELINRVKSYVESITEEINKISNSITRSIKSEEDSLGLVDLKEKISETMDLIRNQTAAVEQTLATKFFNSNFNSSFFIQNTSITLYLFSINISVTINAFNL